MEYKVFIENITHYVDRLKAIMDKPSLSYSFEHIDEVQKFYAVNYNSPENFGVTYDELTYSFYAYVGEAFIHHHGGNWELSTFKNDDAFGTPIIVNWGPKDYPWTRISPYVWKTLIEREVFRGNLSEAIK